MTKSIGLLLAIAAVLALLVAFNPEARANAIEAWAQVKVAWSDFSEQFGDSMGALRSEFAQRFDQMSAPDNQQKPAAREDESGPVRLSSFLQRMWLSVSARLNVQ